MTRRDKTLPVACLVVAAVCACGCASFGNVEATCSWVEVVAEGTTIRATRQLAGYSTDACGSAGEYVLNRSTYTLEFWNGSGLGAQLFVRATDREGKALEIQSDMFAKVDSKLASLSDARMSAYSHVFTASRHAPSGVIPSLESLDLFIASSDGQVVARESVPVAIKIGRFRYREGL